MAATYLAVPVKRTWEVDFQKPLSTFISSTFTNADPDDYKSAIQDFNKLRSNAISKSGDKHESTLDIWNRLVSY